MVLSDMKMLRTYCMVIMTLFAFPCLAIENAMDNQNRINGNNIPVRVKSTPLQEGIWHTTCFILADESQHDPARQQNHQHNPYKDVCCREIAREVLTNDVSVADGDEKHQEVHKYCLAHVASVPSNEGVLGQVDKVKPSLALADYSLVMHLTGDQYISKNPNSHSKDSPWWLEDSEGSLSAESLSEESDDQLTRSASVQSTLSEDGGMHRIITHVVSVQTPFTSTIPSTWNGTIDMLLVVPEDFFMDMDDPLEGIVCPNVASDCGVEYHLVTNDVVDIEQPAFDSPQHVVRIELKCLFHQRQQESSSFQIEFATKIHTRYPMPVAGRSIHTSEAIGDPSMRVRIGLPAPRITGGTWTYAHMNKQPSTWRIQEAVEQQDGETWLSTTVPAGSEEDYPLVTIVTLVFALLGAALTLRDLSLVSNWDET